MAAPNVQRDWPQYIDGLERNLNALSEGLEHNLSEERLVKISMQWRLISNALQEAAGSVNRLQGKERAGLKSRVAELQERALTLAETVQNRFGIHLQTHGAK